MWLYLFFCGSVEEAFSPEHPGKSCCRSKVHMVRLWRVQAIDTYVYAGLGMTFGSSVLFITCTRTTGPLYHLESQGRIIGAFYSPSNSESFPSGAGPWFVIEYFEVPKVNNFCLVLGVWGVWQIAHQCLCAVPSSSLKKPPSIGQQPHKYCQ